jgi:hypothetical protein
MKEATNINGEVEEIEINEIFYFVDILREIGNKIGRECEYEDIRQETIYWSGSFEVKDLNVKIRCKGESKNNDIILIETVGKIYVEGEEITSAELYPAEEVVEKLYEKYRTLYVS